MYFSLMYKGKKEKKKGGGGSIKVYIKEKERGEN